MAYVKKDPRFGRGLRLLMQREELSIRMTAEFADIDKNSVSRIQRGAITPTKATKERLARVFRMTVKEVEALGAEEIKADKAAPGGTGTDRQRRAARGAAG